MTQTPTRLALAASLALLGACAELGPEHAMSAPPTSAFATSKTQAEMGWCIARAWNGPDAALPAYQADGSLLLAFRPRDKDTTVVRIDAVKEGAFVTVWDRSRTIAGTLAIAGCRGDPPTG